jgi:Tfp pilus tip-associated adhesin PilY1
VADSSARRSGGLALDGAGAAYVGGNFSPLGVTLDSVHEVVYVSTCEGQLWRFSLRVLQSPEPIEIRTGV